MARTVHRLYDAQAQKILDRENLPIAYWYYLRVLAARGEINQLELSKRVGIASTTAVPALDNLEKRGLVQRTRDPNDRRKYFVSLKDDGKRLVDEMMPELIDMISASLDGITQRDMRVFWKVMHQIENNLNQASQGDAVVD
jgi:MarR family transcriptional regulator for hemolysin